MAGKNSIMPNSIITWLATLFGVQQPPNRLLSLPAELRSQIHAEIITASTILVRPEWRDTVLHFHPAPPTFLQTCQQIRSEVQESYYANSTFYFTDPMFQSGVMAAFSAAYGPMLKHMRRIKIRHTGVVVLRGHWSVDYDVAFILHSRPDGISITGHTAVSRTLVDPDGDGEVKVCCCSLADLVASSNTEKNGGLLMDILIKYAGLSNVYEAGVQNNELCFARRASVACERCGCVKGI